MKRIEGTATISIEKLDDLRECEELLFNLQRDVKSLVKDIEHEEFDKIGKQIDGMSDLSDAEFEKLMDKANMTLKIIVSDRTLRNLIREYIDGEASEHHYALEEMGSEKFAQIPLILESSQRAEEAAGQQDKTICEMCEAYMADAECDMKEDCPAAGIIKRLKEAEKTIEVKEKIIKESDKTIRKLKKELSDLRVEKSYMTNPMAIGDRHEMGG